MFTLAGINVLDLGDRAATAWCSRLLADFGAEVQAVEPPDGHPLRRHPPFDAAGRSIPARYFLANKAAVPKDEGLAASAHVIVTSSLAAAGLASAHRSAIVCAITAHGLTGPKRHLPGNELTAAARSGWASVNGVLGQAPLKGSGYQAAYQTGTLAFGAVVCALAEQNAAGSAGQLIDISEWETLVSSLGPPLLRAQYSGVVWPRHEPDIDMDAGPVPVRDGYFALPLSRPAFWQKAMQLLGLPELADDPQLREPGLRRKFKGRYAAPVQERMAEWNRLDLFAALARERVVAGPVLRLDEMASNPQFAARDFFVRSQAGTRFPGPPARFGASAWQLRREMGETSADAAGFKAPAKPPRAAHAQRRPSPERGPLHGFRGLVLTQAWAGSYATMLLALLGAEVIQVESRKRLDSWRGTYRNPMPKRLREVQTAQHPWNCNPLYNSVNLHKRCITLDLADAAGVHLFKRLVPHVDFVAENFSPRVMGNLGLGYDTLAAIKPNLVMASLSAYGATGPWANVPGIGGTIEPSCGMSSLLGYEGGAPLNSGQMYPDPVAGFCGFAAIATALLHRDRTGVGQFIDLSMQEANFTFIGDAWLEFEATGRLRGPLGNRHPLHAPHGIYRARGEDQWIAIAAETETQWLACCAVLSIDAAVWPDNAARKTHEAEVDAAIAASVRDRDKLALEDALCRVGVPAAAVLNAAEVAQDGGLRQRGALARVHHAETGPMWQAGSPAAFSGARADGIRPAPLHGEHSFEVFAEFLGMTRAEYDALETRGVTGKGDYQP